MQNSFIAAILTHGRAGNVKTIKALKEAGYTGEVAIVIDTHDSQAETYRHNFGDSVWQFDKDDWAGIVDDGDNSGDYRAVVYARNAAIQMARDRGYRWIWQLDDDYVAFHYKTDSFLRYTSKKIKSLDKVLSAFVEYASKADIACFAFSQEGDHIGGPKSIYNKTIRAKRKAMNSMLIRTDRPVGYVGKVNEDATMATLENMRGNLVMTFMPLSLSQTVTQQNPGGLTDIYLDQGTYLKSFYSVMYAPSAVKVKNMVVGEKRLHHIVDYEKCSPCIIREQHRKSRAA